MQDELSRCLYCKKSIQQVKQGRRRVYCSIACKTAQFRLNRKKAKEEFLRREINFIMDPSYLRFHKETTLITLGEILEEYGEGAAFLAAQAIEEEVRARKLSLKRSQ